LRWLAFKPGGAATLPEGSDRPKAESPVAAAATGQVAANRMVPTAPAIKPSAEPVQGAAGPAKLTTVAQTVAQDLSPDLGPEPPPWDDLPPSSSEHDANAEAMLAGWDDVPLPQGAPQNEPNRQSTRRATEAGPAARSEAPPVATVVPQVPRTELGNRWADVVKQLVERGLVAALVRELALQAECVAVDDSQGKSVWRLRVERENLRSAAQQEKLTQALTRLLGGEVALELEAGIGKDTPALRDQAERASRQAAAEVLIRQDPMVVGLLQHFPGSRIVAGSVSPL
jgi:DNA polymerase III subunit gamma/tau